MIKPTGVVISLVAFCVAALLPALPLWAEDEDLDSTVYIVFDPETGELTTVEEPSGRKKKHSSTNATPKPGTQEPATDAAKAEPVSVLLGGVLALGLMGGAIAWIRKSRKSS